MPDWETPLDDAAEQRMPATGTSQEAGDDDSDADAPAALHDHPPLSDVDEADAAEQALSVPSGDDDYR